MLTESDKLLLTAAVDGELTPAEAKAFDRLIATNPEAGRLFRRLKANADRLAALPRPTAPPALAARVMARVRPAAPARRPAPARRSFLPYLVAASLFLAVTVGSAVLFRSAAGTDQAQRDHLPPTGTPVVPPAPARQAVDPVAVARGGAGEDGAVKGSDAAGAIARVEPAEPRPEVVAQAPPPLTPQEKELFGVGLMVGSKPLKQVEPALPVLFSALAFNQDDTQARLKKELARDGGFRLNLFSKNPTAAVDQLAAAARAAGVSVFVEANTAERVKKQFPLHYAVYLDNLTADELAALLAGLSRQAGEQPKPETVLGPAHLVPADAAEHKEVKDLLGLEWAPKAKPAEGKAVSDGTLKEVVASVKKPGEKAAVVVTALPRQAAGRTAEVKQFVEKRGERKPGTVPLLVVIRPQP